MKNAKYIVEIFVNGIPVERKFFIYENRLINTLNVLTKYYPSEDIVIYDEYRNRWTAKSYLSQVLHQD